MTGGNLYGAANFDVASVAKPLLHLRSLGVEEQFYIVWLIVIIATTRPKSLRLGAL